MVTREDRSVTTSPENRDSTEQPVEQVPEQQQEQPEIEDQFQKADEEKFRKQLKRISADRHPPNLGKEYEAMGKILKLIPSYILSWYLLGFFALGFYLQFSDYAQTVLRANGGVNAWWFALFHVVSAFNNAGFSLFALNLIPFASNT